MENAVNHRNPALSKAEHIDPSFLQSPHLAHINRITFVSL